MRITFLALSLCVLLSALPAAADIVHLKNGGRVEGTVEDLGDTYRVKLHAGSVTIQKSAVAGIEEKPTALETLEEKRAGADLKDPDAHVALALWCREQGLTAEAEEELAAAIRLDPDHAEARRALGHIYYEGAWRTEEEIMTSKGFVRVEGEWITREEAEARAAREAEDHRVRDIEKRLNREFRRLAGSSDRRREKAFDEIVTLARELESKELEDFAVEAKAYYDEAWRIVRSQTAIMEIRAQWSRLKRPIPTLSTTLGTGTPVKIQLPEMAIASVGSTVVVPLGGK